MIVSQGDSRGWFVSVCKLTLLCAGLWSATCEFTSQSKIICLLLFMFWNPAYFGVVAFLLQGHAEQSTVLTHHLVVFELIYWNWSTHQFLLFACRHLLQFLQVLRKCLNQTKLITGIYWNGVFSPKVRHKMKFILSRPSFSLKKEVCYHWDFGSNSVISCLSTSCPCDLPLHKILLSLHRDDRIGSFTLMTTSYPGKPGMRSGEQIAHVGL